MIRLYKIDDSGFKDFSNSIFSSNSCVFDFTAKTVTVGTDVFRIPVEDEIGNIHSTYTADTNIKIDYYSAIFINTGECDVLLNTTKIKAGESLSFGGYNKRILQNYQIQFSGIGIKELQLIMEVSQ